MTRYRKKQVEVEAVQWAGENGAEIAEILGYPSNDWRNELGVLVISDFYRVVRGNFVVRHPDGATEAVSAHRFEATYEPADLPRSDLLSKLEEEIARLREAAAKCRDNSCRAMDPLRGGSLLAEGEAHDAHADDLEAILDRLPQHPQLGEGREAVESILIGTLEFPADIDRITDEVLAALVRPEKDRTGSSDRLRHIADLLEDPHGDHGHPIYEDDHADWLRDFVARSPHPGEGEGREAKLLRALERAGVFLVGLVDGQQYSPETMAEIRDEVRGALGAQSGAWVAVPFRRVEAKYFAGVPHDELSEQVDETDWEEFRKRLRTALAEQGEEAGDGGE